MSTSKLTIPLPLQYIPSNRLGDLDFDGEVSLTKQAEKDSCDINQIMANAARNGGLVEHLNQKAPIFADLSATSSDYHAAMDIIADANEAFDALPADIRKRFGNDPAEFLDFFNDPENVPEMIKMGLAEAPPSPEPSPSPSKDAPDSPEGAA